VLGARGQPPTHVEGRIEQGLRADGEGELVLGLLQGDGGEACARAVARNRDALGIEP
jgi:hypothetical protein